MYIRRSILLAAIAAGAALAPAAYAARVDVELNYGPPAPIYEPVPAPRYGYVWAPGYWEYRPYHRHHWVRGHWIRERHGYAWVGPRWEERRGRWYYSDGRWEREHG